MKHTKKKLYLSIDMDDAWVNYIKEESFLSNSFENILKIFNSKKYKPTLFIIGKDIKKHKTFLKKAVSMNFELGNHGYSHKFLNKLSVNEFASEINKAHIALSKFQKIVSFRAPGWSTNHLVDKKILELDYKIDASRINGIMFVILKLVHLIFSRENTGIYGEFNTLIFNKTNRNINLKYLNLHCVCGIPFYHSVIKFIPKFICKKLIQLSTKKEVISYIFHARDFKSENLVKTIEILNFLEKNYSLNSLRDSIKLE